MIGRPFVITRVVPRPTASMAKVAMKEGILTRDTRSPLTAPASIPTPRPPRIPTMGGTPTHLISAAVIAPPKASIDPGDKSIPPVRITKVSPADKTAIIAT